MDAVARRARTAVHLGGVAGVGVHQHELADVVKQAGDRQAVAVLVADLARHAVSGMLRGQRVQSEALRSGVPDARALKEVKRAQLRGQRQHGLRAEELDGANDRVHSTPAILDAIGQAQHGDDQCDIRLDRRHDVRGRDVLFAGYGEQPVARLGKRGERLQRFEGRRQSTAVALVLWALGCAALCAIRALAVGARGRSGLFLARGGGAALGGALFWLACCCRHWL